MLAGATRANGAKYAGSGNARSTPPSSTRPHRWLPICQIPVTSAKMIASCAAPSGARSSITRAAVSPSTSSRSASALVRVGANRAAISSASLTVADAIAAKPTKPCHEIRICRPRWKPIAGSRVRARARSTSAITVASGSRPAGAARPSAVRPVPARSCSGVTRQRATSCTRCSAWTAGNVGSSRMRGPG
jgi:hypothetical protein